MISPLSNSMPAKIARPGASTEVDMIATSIAMCIEKLHYCHHNTTSHAMHQALDYAYDAISDLKDEILEKMIGYTGQRYKKLSLTSIEGDANLMAGQVAEEILGFGKYLEGYAEMNGYCDLENLAQSYSGVGAKLKYLLTLS